MKVRYIGKTTISFGLGNSWIPNLTNDEVYEVILENDKCYVINDDLGIRKAVKKEDFEIVPEPIKESDVK